MKYIDAYKLYKQVDELMVHFAELENETKLSNKDLSIFYQGKKEMCSELLGIIDSLQQEQPDVKLDERIRMALCDIVRDVPYIETELGAHGLTVEKTLAYLEKQKERGPLTKEEEYTLHRIIEYLEDEACPSEWISLLHDIYCLPYEKQKESLPISESCKENADSFTDEDERIRKAIVTLIEKLQRYSTNYAGVDPTDMLAYLEKQKEQPQEELVYRMNGLMQEYVKEGEDDAEKEHRLKCYQLFWDALEDADFFEQKEQKPNHDKEKLIKHCIGMILTDATEKRFKDYGLTLKDCLTWLSVQKEQKMLAVDLEKEIQRYLCEECSSDDEPTIAEIARHFYELGRTEGIKGNFPKSNTNSPSEWSEEDEKMRINILNALTPHLVYSVGKGTYTGASTYRYDDEIRWFKSLPERFNLQPQAKQEQKEPSDKGEISDGYHTFNELYYYRLLYNAAFFNLLPKEWVHKSKKHHDGEECFGGGWFIVMANLPTGQISNHYEIKDWDLFHIPEKETADKWDGHTPQEAAERLHKFLLEKPDSMPIAWRDIREDKQKPETKLTGWVARDSEHNSYHGLGLVLFNGKPRRTGDCWSGEIVSHLPWRLFPDLKWNDEPMEVEMIITKKKC